MTERQEDDVVKITSILFLFHREYRQYQFIGRYNATPGSCNACIMSLNRNHPIPVFLPAAGTGGLRRGRWD